MATLQNIRNRGVLIAIVVGVALLAFIIGDFLNSGSSLFQERKQTVAELNGEKIKITEYQEKVDQYLSVYKMETGRSDFNETEMSQIRQQVWDNMINEKIIEAEAAKIGISVGKEELTKRLIGNNIHPLIMQRPFFADQQTGQFSKAALLQFYNAVFDKNHTPMEQEQMREYRSYWMFWENTVRNSLLQDKYMALLAQSVAVTSDEAGFNYEARKMSGDVNYVVQSYFSIPDSTIEVSNSELKALYDKRKEQFKQLPNRSIEYVTFEVAPLQEDFDEGEEWIAKVSEEFKTADDVSELVNTESDVSYDGMAVTRQQVPAHLRDFAFSSAKGAIYGPEFENNTYTMAKVVETGIVESDSVKLRMIMLEPEADKTADSIISAIRGGAAFADLVAKYNPQGAATEGEVGWINRNMRGLDKELSDQAFSKGSNELFKVNNMNGVQIFQVMEKTPARQKVKLAILERAITPGNQSYSTFFNEAKAFAAEATTPEKFKELAQEKGYVVKPAMQLTKNSENIANIPQTRQVVRWVFENKKGAVSDVFDCDRNTYMVAMVNEISEKEYAELNEVSPQLKAELLRNKKAEVITKQLNEQLEKTPSLEGLAEALKLDVQYATDVNFASYQFGDMGMEPTVIGKASVTPENMVSKPVKGEAGVYVLMPMPKSADETAFDAEIEKAQLNMRIAQSLPYTILQTLRDKYNVTDNRSNFY